jgi:hypothetical protein
MPTMQVSDAADSDACEAEPEAALVVATPPRKEVVQDVVLNEARVQALKTRLQNVLYFLKSNM